ncbi:glutaredoxin family protein [Parapedobacter lycopersici]|uniref:glutaredoxin family protein n=1 Tax=Parapedobacter lycopersici TaxID=1864939 RepID=UPI00214D8D3F|nr:glutaredoxin family protein [Parapedobacter lycopersici]
MTRIIKFEKNDCAPCNQVSEYLDRKGINYEKVNPFDKPELAIQYKVRTVPTVIVLSQGQETQRIIGFKPEELSALAAE